MLYRAVIQFIKEFWLPILVVVLGALLAVIYNAQLDKAHKQGYDKAKAEYERKIDNANREANRKIAQVDATRTAELEAHQKELGALRASVRTGRVYIKATCPPNGSSNSSLGYGSEGAELDREVAQRLIDIANDGDAAIIQLGAAQDIIRALSVKEE